MASEPERMAAMYWRTKRKPREGTASEALKVHAQACGVVAYVFDVHPDTVAQALAEVPVQEARDGE